MVDTKTEIQAQLEAANTRLMRRRRELAERDRPVHAGVVAAVVLLAMMREAEEVR